MTTRTTAVDHPSRRLVVALPQAHDEAREHYESPVPEIDFARFSEMASWQATLDLAEINAGMSGSPSSWKTTQYLMGNHTMLYIDPDGDTKLAVDQPSLLFELDGLLAGLITWLGGDMPLQFGTARKAS
ncbi:MAG: hypothetical protein QOI29_3408 [Mycobacterium sp.]|jgi:hypothetical protein|nr:hypothetical protein [Mycobacterium sp.]